MARRKNGAVRKGHGVMCNICGLNCGKGGALKKHIEVGHKIKYEDYNICFYRKAKPVIANSWDDSVNTAEGKTVITHVLVRRFIREKSLRGVPRAARVK